MTGEQIVLSSDAIEGMRHTIMTWYAEHRRSLPWRETINPYKILVSEVMLQQTQVSRVIPKYHAFLVSFPTVGALADASTADVIRHRSGLGFNRRALNLQRACQQIVELHDGEVPATYDELLALRGVGPYTSGAVMAFAYNADVPVVDINIKRVHIAMLELPHEISDRQMREVARQTQPPGQARDWYNALMDYGSAVLHAKRTGIRSTPQSTFAGSRREGRGQILKYLTTNNHATRDDLVAQMSHPDALQIIDEMIAEGFVIQEGDVIRLME